MARGPRHFEKKMRIIVLKVAAASRNGQLSTTEAKERAAGYFEPTEGDLRRNPKRGGEPMFYQIVGNVIGSHEHTTTSLYYNGLAERTEDGLRITEQGRAFLKALAGPYE